MLALWAALFLGQQDISSQGMAHLVQLMHTARACSSIETSAFPCAMFVRTRCALQHCKTFRSMNK